MSAQIVSDTQDIVTIKITGVVGAGDNAAGRIVDLIRKLGPAIVAGSH